jgi:metallo-beta-lactamase family protein
MITYSNQSTEPKVTFWGAAQSVTGSMHLLETGPHRLLLDCGLHRGPREEALSRNRTFPFQPSTLTAVVLSHAHVDHCGNLPNLVRQGYTGPIYCTPATRDLISVMLADSARIQEDEAETTALIRDGKNGSALGRQPLYTRADARQTVAQCVAVAYGQPIKVNDDIGLTFSDAGHILGSAITALQLNQGGRDFRVTFTGDLGRRGLPFGREPSPVPAADLLICESTYGNRIHDPVSRMAERMTQAVIRTRERGGKVLIPAFSLGRTQIVLHYLQRWMRAGLVPKLPLYVDSPLAADISKVYKQHENELAGDLVDDPPVHYLDTPEESRAVTKDAKSCIIIASGGMCEGGRIVQHLKHHLDDPRSTIVLVSYQAPGSMGSRLLEKRPSVRFMGRNWNKWVEVVELNGFSGHADREDFLALLGPAAATTGRVRLVHGDPEQALALAKTLRERGFADVEVPHREDVVSVA